MGSKYVLEYATVKCVQDPVNRVDHIISRLHCWVDRFANISSHEIGIWDRRRGWDLVVCVAKAEVILPSRD